MHLKIFNVRKNYLEQFLFVNTGDMGVNLPGKCKQTTSSPQKSIPFSIILLHIEDLLRYSSTVNNNSFPRHTSSKGYYKRTPLNGGGVSPSTFFHR